MPKAKNADRYSASDRAAIQCLWDRHRERAKAGWERMQRRAKLRRNEPFNPKARARKVMEIDADVFAQAVAENGDEALNFDSTWWKDQKRRNPWLCDGHDMPGSAFRPTAFFRDGFWWRRSGNGYVKEAPVRRDWSKE